MHRYLMSVPKYFGGEFRFEVEAMDKTDAVLKAKDYIETMLGRDNLIREGLICVKKLKPSFGEEYEKKMQSFK